MNCHPSNYFSTGVSIQAMLPNLPMRLVKNLVNFPAVVRQSIIDSYEKLKSTDYRPIYEIYDNLTGLDRVRSLHVGVAEVSHVLRLNLSTSQYFSVDEI